MRHSDIHGDVAPTMSPALRFRGRIGSNSAERRFRSKVEQVMYSLDKPVFHYQGTFSEANRQLNVSAVEPWRWVCQRFS
jgi:hypothetical protein